MSKLIPGVGSIVTCRERNWVVIPSTQESVVMLRPLAGGEEEICGVSKALQDHDIDLIESADFPLPDPAQAGDATSAGLLFDAARLTLRDGAGPFRSLGRVSVRPRPYQFVPMLMALRLDPIRLLISDDVGVGKTIEAGVIARELLDRGEIKSLCVLCPPYLCDQWRRELSEKFHIDAVVVNSGTISALERRLPQGDHSIFAYFPYTVVSIDYAKGTRHRQNFLANCAELVIVDEVHGAAKPSGRSASQQQRHALLKELSEDKERHLVLLTATPHSGVEEAFLSILGLLDPNFEHLDLENLSEKERDRLARHFVQRRRADVANWMGEETHFPERLPLEAHYELSAPYRKLFEGVYDFSRELVAPVEGLTAWKQRIRYWTALALLRCVMSSPAAASAAITKRLRGLGYEEETTDEDFLPSIYETEEGEPLDLAPSQIIEEGAEELPDSEARKLRAFAAQAEKLKGEDDYKLAKCLEMVEGMLEEGHSPIVWCRFIATSDYVAEELSRRLARRYPELRVVSITGADDSELRESKVGELASSPRRVLVSTDCLSEGVNLQEHFDAVIHYDLPWNPNRLEQREGRVDRFGQTATSVKAVLLYGRDNPVDGAVLEVLLRKARDIHKTLKISVPVPVGSETVMEAVLESLFFKGKDASQLTLQLFETPEVDKIDRLWDRAAEREKQSRTRFAQRAIKPDEVDRELQEADSILGDPGAVREFVLEVCRRMEVVAKKKKDGTYSLASLDRFPEPIRRTLPQDGERRLAFESPAPEGSIYIGRNHPFVSSLARYLLEEAMIGREGALASRCGAMRTNHGLERRTTLLLLRCRYTLTAPGTDDLLAEEVLPLAFTGSLSAGANWLSQEDAKHLMRDSAPESNTPQAERVEVLEESIEWYEGLKPDIKGILDDRAQALQTSHKRVRESAKVSRRGVMVTRHLPPDLLGIMVLLPVPKGVKR